MSLRYYFTKTKRKKTHTHKPRRVSRYWLATTGYDFSSRNRHSSCLIVSHLQADSDVRHKFTTSLPTRGSVSTRRFPRLATTETNTQSRRSSTGVVLVRGRVLHVEQSRFSAVSKSEGRGSRWCNAARRRAGATRAWKQWYTYDFHGRGGGGGEDEGKNERKQEKTRGRRRERARRRWCAQWQHCVLSGLAAS